MKMTNHHNLIAYRLWAPIYDATVNHIFLPGRKRAMELLNLQAGEKVYLVGVGTGADLPLLPAGVDATGMRPQPGDARQGSSQADAKTGSLKIDPG